MEMKDRKLKFRFHNPNTVEISAEYILKILIKANVQKADNAIRTAAIQGYRQTNEE